MKKEKVANSASNHSSFEILCWACQNHPPLHIIKFFCEMDPAIAFMKDGDDRSALHIACKYGCSPKVIKYLLDLNPIATKEVDRKSRSPIILAFKSYVQKRGRESVSANEDLYRVAVILMSVDSYVHAKDCNGMTPLNYAIMGNHGAALVQLVQ